MVNNKWEHLSFTDNAWETHHNRWAFIKTEIPDAMNSLDLATLSKTYPEEWLKTPALDWLHELELWRSRREEEENKERGKQEDLTKLDQV